MSRLTAALDKGLAQSCFVQPTKGHFYSTLGAGPRAARTGEAPAHPRPLGAGPRAGPHWAGPSPSPAPAQETLARPWLGRRGWGHTCRRLPRPSDPPEVSPFRALAWPCPLTSAARLLAVEPGASSLHDEEGRPPVGRGSHAAREQSTADGPQRRGGGPCSGVWAVRTPVLPPGPRPCCSLARSTRPTPPWTRWPRGTTLAHMSCAGQRSVEFTLGRVVATSPGTLDCQHRPEAGQDRELSTPSAFRGSAAPPAPRTAAREP